MSSIFRLTDKVVVNDTLPIPLDTNILTTPVSIVKEELAPGLGGHVRLWFALATTGNLPTAIKATTTKNTGSGAAGVLTVVAGAVTAASVTAPGINYKNGERVRLVGDTSGDGNAEGILTVDANGGIISIAIVLGGKTYTDTDTYTIAGLTNVGFVNADNTFSIKSGGLYWFDVPIFEEMTLNFEAAAPPDASFTAATIEHIDLLEIQKIIFGA